MAVVSSVLDAWPLQQQDFALRAVQAARVDTIQECLCTNAIDAKQESWCMKKHSVEHATDKSKQSAVSGHKP